MPKIIRILSKDHVTTSMKILCKCPTIVDQLNFWLVICFAKNFIWITLKANFSIIFYFAPSDSWFLNCCLSAKSCPILTSRIPMESLFILISDDVYIYFWDWFCGPGSHIGCYLTFRALWVLIWPRLWHKNVLLMLLLWWYYRSVNVCKDFVVLP